MFSVMCPLGADKCRLRLSLCFVAHSVESCTHMFTSYVNFTTEFTEQEGVVFRQLYVCVR